MIFNNCTYVTTILVLCFLIPSCRKVNVSNNEIIKVKTVAPVEMEINKTMKSIGSITYKSKHNISCSVEGNVSEIFVKDGDYVKKGQVLGRLKNIQLQIQKEQCENNLEESKSALLIAEAKLRDDILGVKSRLISIDKQKLSLQQQELEYEEACIQQDKNEKLFSIGGLTKNSLKQQELKISAMKAALDMAKKDFEMSELGLRDEDIEFYGKKVPLSDEKKCEILLEINTMSSAAYVESEKARVINAEKNLDSINRLIDELNLKASVDGIVGSIGYEEGEHVDVNSIVFTLMDISSVNAVFYVQENDIRFYEINGLVSVEIPSLESAVECKISEISPIADPQTGNFWIKCLVPNTNNELKPGMFVKIEMKKLQMEKYLSLPESAVMLIASDKAQVYISANGIAITKNIVIKSKENGMILIESGIEITDKIIDRPSPFMKEGDLIDEI